MEFSIVMHQWAWIGLGAAIFMLIWLFCTDYLRVKKGNYTLRIEATLINDRIVTYTGLVRVGSKPSDVPLTQSLAGSDTSHDTMITDVKASLK